MRRLVSCAGVLLLLAALLLAALSPTAVVATARRGKKKRRISERHFLTEFYLFILVPWPHTRILQRDSAVQTAFDLRMIGSSIECLSLPINGI
jgi:hypothetical protein